ncbi:IMP-specific 5'-nucleotidase 1 [Uncinocarpus reesii 1704]|uniref:Lysophospholipase NTE1 n=1 Tax=Uncinocarpus reesii (strain UAMH 1704) TaxID=336963 RepID=C4JI49_UNCRE|nr:IMP-specific 5'-nucleotidase 1 [Uncinocarpus reesii 1704]EEP77946.1 IMP-specific 5'-nucleotidase 1 [Uncinocarpus reesii 1704]
MTTRYRVEYALKSHRRDQLGLLAVPFVLHSQPAAIYNEHSQNLVYLAERTHDRYVEIMRDVEHLINDHIKHQNSGTSGRSTLKMLIPSVGTFFTPLLLEEAFEYQDKKRFISSRRFVPPSFNDIRLTLNTAQLMGLVRRSQVQLITFDGDVTLYEDGASLTPDNEVISRIIRLLGQNKQVGIVTAAGYVSADKYYDRLHGLLDRIQGATELTATQKKSLIILGGESNFMFEFDPDSPHRLSWVPRSQWLLEEMKAWTEEDIKELLDVAEAALRDCVSNLNLPASILRKERAVGIYPLEGHRMHREQLEETVLVAQQTVETSAVGRRLPFCAFNGGNDVFVDIGDKSWGVLCCQTYFGGIDRSKTLHIGDQFLSAGANDFKVMAENPAAVAPDRPASHLISSPGSDAGGLRSPQIASISSSTASSPTDAWNPDPLTSSRPVFSFSTSLPPCPSPATSSCPTISPPDLLQGIVPQLAMASYIGRFLLYLFQVVPSLLYWVITFSTITVPTALFTLFSMSLTFTMNFTTFWFIRYRFLNIYSRLPPEPQRKEPEIDLFPDSQDGDSKPGLSNYLDEFLSAIKVFGYLERPVFHELTRTMQTRKLIAGETLLLEEEKGFCLVVDGLVQIFVKSMQERHDDRDGGPVDEMVEDSAEEDDGLRRRGHQGYQLLTEVKNGASMSSLFSILSLFSEDVKLRHTEDMESSSSSFVGTNVPGPESLPMSPAPLMESPMRSNFSDQRDISAQLAGGALPKVPPLVLEGSPGQHPKHHGHKRTRPSKLKREKSVHPDILARAMVDTTIAIIPASAFRRLTRVYPKATAHIIQVILTRLQRVTFATAHSYLGLTTEVLSIGKQMTKYTSFDLPNHLRGAALDHLKDKFTKEKERLGPEDGAKGIALHNPAANRRRRSSSSLRKDAAIHAKFTAVRGKGTSPNGPRYGDHESTGVSPGDLLSTIQLSRFGPRYGSERLNGRSVFYDATSGLKSPAEGPPSPLATAGQPLFKLPAQNVSFQRQDALDQDALFRESILDCMMKALGLTGSTTDALRKAQNSGDASPQLVSYDSRRQKAVFNNAFGFIDPYDGLCDGDSESLMSMSVTSAGGTSPIHSLRLELQDEIEIVYFPKGSVLVEQGERNPGLYYVIDGFLDVGIPVNEKGEDLIGSSRGPTAEDLLLPITGAVGNASRVSTTLGSGQFQRKKASRRSLYMVKPGGIEGYIGSITSYRSFTDVTAKTDVYVGFLPRTVLERIADRYPLVMLTMAKRLTTVLPRLILHIDFALEWVQVNAGQVIYHQSDESDAIYIVLNGRLRSVLDKGDGKVSVVGEYGQGDSVGELEVMTESTRPATLHAIRDTELAKFPRTLFNSLAQEHPGITIQISKLIAQRMRHIIDNPLERGGDKGSPDSAKTTTSTLNLRTVAVLPVTAGIPVVEFGNRLLNAFSQVGVTNGVTSLHQADILNHLGRHAFSKMGKLKLAQYLADLEERYGMVLYIGDTSVNAPWTQTCISQADCILLVAVAEGSPAIGEYERFLLGMKTTARKDLVLLHVERYSPPGLTRQWLKNRMWINGGHHHIQMAFRLTAEPVHPETKRLGAVLKQRVQVIQAEIQKYTSRRIRQTPVYSTSTPFKGDFFRLARRLCGKSVGIVLGGGGARGIAHIGVIKALEEAGIPIDIIGGTSIGSFIGGLYARDADVVPAYGRVKKFAGRMASMWRFALDLTYPSASYTTGHEFNRGIFKAFGNSHIEDFWLEFYCNTTNISKSRNEFHSSGYAWRYVRASMSLAGLLPPLCDEGNMLLDGGYVDNLTVARMKSLGADVIFAVDVGSIDDNTPQGYGDSLSGFWALVNRWNPFSSLPNPPTLSEIQARLAYVSSVDALERAKTMPGCLYMRPPIDAFGTLEFGKFDEIYQVGYKFGKEFLERLKNEGGLPIQEETEEKKKLRRTMAPRRASI